MLRHFAFCLNFRSSDLNIYWLLPFRRTLDFHFDCFNAVTQRWHQLLAGFRFEAAGPTLHLSLLNWKFTHWDICSVVRLIANDGRGFMTCDKYEAHQSRATTCDKYEAHVTCDKWVKVRRL